MIKFPHHPDAYCDLCKKIIPAECYFTDSNMVCLECYYKWRREINKGGRRT